MSDSREYGLPKLLADPERFKLLRKEDDVIIAEVLEELEVALIKEVLKELRAESGLSQSELNKMSGIAQPMISRVEREGTPVTLGTLQRVAAAFGYAVHLEVLPRKEALSLLEKDIKRRRR